MWELVVDFSLYLQPLSTTQTILKQEQLVAVQVAQYSDHMHK